jgi:hypothetical protein
MHKNTTKCNKTQSKWCINKHGASKIIDTFETYHCIFKHLGFSDEERLVGSRVYIPKCLHVARDEDEGSLSLCFLLCIVRLETYVTGFML